MWNASSSLSSIPTSPSRASSENRSTSPPGISLGDGNARNCSTDEISYAPGMTSAGGASSSYHDSPIPDLNKTPEENERSLQENERSLQAPTEKKIIEKRDGWWRLSIDHIRSTYGDAVFKKMPSKGNQEGRQIGKPLKPAKIMADTWCKIVGDGISPKNMDPPMNSYFQKDGTWANTDRATSYKEALRRTSFNWPYFQDEQDSFKRNNTFKRK